MSAGISLLSTENLARFVMFALAGTGAALYSYGANRGNAKLTRLILQLFALYALSHVLFIGYLWANHAAFPLNLEAMELTVLQHFRRANAGLPIYAEPSPEFVALAYNPLYYLLAMPFAWLFGVNLFTLRLVAILGMLGSGLVIYLAVRKHTDSTWWGLMAAGLFAAAYSVMDTYLDNAHSDSWMLFTILLGCYSIALNRSRSSDLFGILLLIVAFWFKQSAAIFAIGGILFLTLRDGWRKSWPYWLMAGMLGPVLYYVTPSWLFGPRFHYFTWEVPSQWTGFDLGTIRRLAAFVLKSYALLAALATAAFALVVVRSGRRSSIWFLLLPIALSSGLVGALDSESNNNVFVPMGVWFIITGVIGLKLLLGRFPAVERWGAHVFVLGASFALFLYNPLSVVVSTDAKPAYRDMVSYLDSLEGSVYAPWVGQLQDSYEFKPAVHWVPMTDLFRGPSIDLHRHPVTLRLLESVVNPDGDAYILMNYPLENDAALVFLLEKYVLDADVGERFAPLKTLPKRYNLGWPRYLYRYAPGEAKSQGLP